MIDYKGLLYRYIWHVGEIEGSCFIPTSEDDFTEEEAKELKRLANAGIEDRDTVTISKEMYAGLLIDEMTVQRLEAGGVDNWLWFGESMNPDDDTDFETARNEIKKTVKELQ